MNKHIILSYALIFMGVLHAQKNISHQQMNCEKPSKEDLQNNISGYLTFIKNKVIIKVTDDEITDLLYDFLNYKPSNKPINGQQAPSSLIAPKNPERPSTSTEALIQTTQTDQRGAVDSSRAINLKESNAHRISNNSSLMNSEHPTAIKKCQINENNRNYGRYKRLLLDIRDRNIRIAEKGREKIRLNKKLNKLLEGETDKICKKSKKNECEQLEISIQYCDTYIDDYKKDITRFNEETNSLCEEDDDEL